MGKTPKIIVIGSFITDLAFRADRRPKRGETIVGKEFGIFTGGKGYNQAVAARRMGADVTMVGCLGKDYFADLFIASLEKERIDHSHLFQDEKSGTGVASPIIYDSEGDNSIIIIPRSNNSLSPEHIDSLENVIAGMDLIMLQLEIPVETCRRAAEIGKKHHIPVMLNPAPARPLPGEFLKMVDIIIPNEVEASQMTGMKIENDDSILQISKKLMEMGPKRVVITLGSRGAFMMDTDNYFHSKAFSVNVIDPTAAGDAFCGSFATALMSDLSPLEAVRYGNAAGALAATVLGAEPSLPTSAQVKEFLENKDR